MSDTELKTIRTLYDQTKELHAGSAHFAIHRPFKDQTATAVISIYDGEKPDHIILAELIDWAEKNNKDDVLDFIHKSAVDLTFLDEGNLRVEDDE